MKRAERIERYRNDYQKQENGAYRYIGQWYAAAQRREWRRYRWRYLAQIVLSAVLPVVMGLVPAGPMLDSRAEGFNYVLLIYGVTLVAAIASAWYAGKVFASKLRMPMHESSNADWHEILTLICTVSSGALAAAQTAYLFVSGYPDDRAGDLILLALALLLFGISLWSWLWQRKLQWTVLENNEA